MYGAAAFFDDVIYEIDIDECFGENWSLIEKSMIG